VSRHPRTRHTTGACQTSSAHPPDTKWLSGPAAPGDAGRGSVGWTLGAALSDGPGLAGIELLSQALSGSWDPALWRRTNLWLSGGLIALAAVALTYRHRVEKAVRGAHVQLQLQLARHLTRRGASSELLATQPVAQRTRPMFGGPDSPGASWPLGVPAGTVSGSTTPSAPSPTHQLLTSELTAQQQAWSAALGDAAVHAPVQNASYSSLNRLGRTQTYSRRGSVPPALATSLLVPS
jgi:hypothetical protein